MRKIQRMWEALNESTDSVVPYLRKGVELEEELALLDFYMMPCIEEFIERGGNFSPRSIILLRNCKCELASLLKKSNGMMIFTRIYGDPKEGINTSIVRT
jgi:hypothetical protein